jgi:hypothetical protein
MLNRLLFKRIDNSPLIVFRVIFGLLITLEAWGAIFMGWVNEKLIDPQAPFNFIGFDFIQPLPGNGMSYYYAVMGLFGVFVMIGYKYRFSISAFTLMWTCVYLMQKSSYNNHYYLLILLCIFMMLVPANRYYSVDVKQNPSLKRFDMPSWVTVFIIAQMGIVYTFASVAKLYPGWLDGTVPEMLTRSRSFLPYIGPILKHEWAPEVMTYFGILFDLSIIPLLLWKRTRIPMFLLAIFFHLFNSFVFWIGIFPYLSLALCLFFFPTQSVHRRLCWKKPYYDKEEIILPSHRKLFIPFLTVWFLLQLALPLRHWFIKDNVLWTEEGHRMSWRMMLRSKSGKAHYKIVDKESGQTQWINYEDYLSEAQYGVVTTKPDVIWQFCQRLEKIYAEKGKDIEIYVNCKISVNGKEYRRLIDPKVDMAAAEWNYFSHNEWLLPEPEEY